MKSLCSPGFKFDDKEQASRSREQPLSRQEATRCRSCVVRLVSLAHDGGDLGERVKCLARPMATPTPGALRDLKNVARYLAGQRHLVMRFEQQIFPKCITTSQVDTKIYRRDGSTIGHDHGQGDKYAFKRDRVDCF